MLSTSNLHSLFGGNIPTAQVLQAVASGLSSAGVTVKIDPGCKCPNADMERKVITLPATLKSVQALRVVNWWLDHEVGHIIWPFNWKRLSQVVERVPKFYGKDRYSELNPPIQKIIFEFFNLVEDSRIEHKMADRFPGSKGNFIRGMEASGLGDAVEANLKEHWESGETVNPIWLALNHSFATLDGYHGAKNPNFIPRSKYFPQDMMWVIEIVDEHFGDLNIVEVTPGVLLAQVDKTLTELFENLKPEEQPSEQQVPYEDSEQQEQGDSAESPSSSSQQTEDESNPVGGEGEEDDAESSCSPRDSEDSGDSEKSSSSEEDEKDENDQEDGSSESSIDLGEGEDEDNGGADSGKSDGADDSAAGDNSFADIEKLVNGCDITDSTKAIKEILLDESGVVADDSIPNYEPSSDDTGMPEAYYAALCPNLPLDVIITSEQMNGDVIPHNKKSIFPNYRKLINTISPKDLGPISRLFVGEFKTSLKHEYAGSKISPRAHQRIAAGTAYGHKIMLKRNETSLSKRGVCVQLVVDTSGSMISKVDERFPRVRRIAVAQAAALGLARFLYKLQIPFEVVGFTTTPYKPSRAKKGYYSRDTGIVNIAYKGFRDVWTQCEDRVIKIGSDIPSVFVNGRMYAMQENSDGESLLWAASRILTRSEKNKIMIVLSDGSPTGGSAPLVGGFLKWVVGQIEKAGVQIGAIGIGTDSPKEYYKKYVNIEQFPKEIKEQREISQFLQELIVEFIYDFLKPGR